MKFNFLHIFITTVTLMIPGNYVLSQVMEGTLYKIQNDSINIGGGFSTSTNYYMQDTVGEVGTGYGTSSTYGVHAGYQQNFVETYITLSAEADVGLGSIGGLVGGIATGSSTWTVTTNNAAGYSLTVVASTTPALKSGAASFADYAPGGPDPDFDFTVAASNSAFGFSPEGVDVIQRFKDNGSVCNAGGSNTLDKCWDGLSTTPKSVATRNSSNHPLGSTTTLKYRVESGASHIQDAGAYSAVVTVTAITL